MNIRTKQRNTSTNPCTLARVKGLPNAPIMRITVDAIEDKDIVTCFWFDNIQNIHKAPFLRHELEFIQEDNIDEIMETVDSTKDILTKEQVSTSINAHDKVDEFLEHVRKARKLQLIKLINTCNDCGLKKAKETVDEYWTGWRANVQ